MGRSRYRILQSQQPHFLTCTVLNWIPLFTRPATVQILLDALLYRQQHHNWRIYGYVILENHLHLLVQADDLPILHSAPADRLFANHQRRAIVAAITLVSQGT